ncbi:hypothetical protein INT47_004596 [Mucor saturninus]|uniref:CCHC-type domain-containing protein n=1 Tax=Mucor saturninus TaxID=64648 RepID=A0A8H7RJ33_9FUNG|nr:hypothetical protein INT47_004596 [Mucor saturninus]
MAMEGNSVLVLGENSAKSAPTFSSGDRQDPVQFLKDFNEAASWNNWVSTDRRKELFFRCLTHYAREWFLNTFERGSEEYKRMKFDDGSDDCLVNKFTAKFVTAEWFAKYEEAYEDRRALLRKLDPIELVGLKEKKTVKEIRKGLLPEVKKFCDYIKKNPYNNLDKTKVNTFEGLEALLRWAEQYHNNTEMATGPNQEVNAILKRNNSGNEGTRAPRSYTDKEEKSNQWDLILKKLEKLDKLDTIENNLALTMDRVDLMERRLDAGVASKVEGRKVDERPSDKCYNCKETGHISKDCGAPCRLCQSSDHTSVTCKDKGHQDFRVHSAGVSDHSRRAKVDERGECSGGLIRLQRKEISYGSEGGSAGEFEKARGAKARYKQEDQEAIRRGEVPPSVLRKVTTGMPIIMEEEGKRVNQFDIREGLWNSQVSIPLPQLLYHSPELYHQALGLLEAQPITVKKSHGSHEEDKMDIDTRREQVSVVNNVVSIDTTTMDLEPTLQALLCIVKNQQLEFLIDGGAVVSVIHLDVVEKLGLKSQIKPTNRTLRFGDGEVEAAVGMVSLTLILSDEVEVTHVFCVTKNVKTPLLVGNDFIQGTNGLVDSNNNMISIRVGESVYKIPTHEGSGVSSEILFPTGNEVVEDERLIIPVTVTNSDHRRLRNVKIQYDYTM